MKRKEKIAAGFLIFLAVMWMCTLISKSIYASQLPRVTTVLAEKRRIEHVVEADGILAGEFIAQNSVKAAGRKQFYTPQMQSLTEQFIAMHNADRCDEM